MSKIAKYNRIYSQLKELTTPINNPISRMATISALLHHKMGVYFWTGFYLLDKGELLVGPYQGPIACLRLKKDVGVCWDGINKGETVIVADVEAFPGHIACNSLTKSEIVVPLIKDGTIIGILDVDSRELNSFDEEDKEGLEKIITLIYN